MLSAINNPLSKSLFPSVIKKNYFHSSLTPCAQNCFCVCASSGIKKFSFSLYQILITCVTFTVIKVFNINEKSKHCQNNLSFKVTRVNTMTMEKIKWCMCLYYLMRYLNETVHYIIFLFFVTYCTRGDVQYTVFTDKRLNVIMGNVLWPSPPFVCLTLTFQCL